MLLNRIRAMNIVQLRTKSLLFNSRRVRDLKSREIINIDKLIGKGAQASFFKLSAGDRSFVWHRYQFR